MADEAKRHEVAKLAKDLSVYLCHLRNHHKLRYWPMDAYVCTKQNLPSTPLQSGIKQLKKLEQGRASEWSASHKVDYLRTKVIGKCTRCELYRSRKKIVFGSGSVDAKIMFVGEAPGADEDRQGEPFVGAAGQRLTQWISEIGLRRDDVYIANVLKCRPPNNRDPRPEEIERCSPFLRAQIRAIGPNVLIALGRFAGQVLIGQSLKLYQMRNLVYEYTDAKDPDLSIPMIVTYHPSYVLRRERSGLKSDRDSSRQSDHDLVVGDLRRALTLVRA